MFSAFNKHDAVKECTRIIIYFYIGTQTLR